MPAKRSAHPAILFLIFGLLTTAPAQTFTVLHTFKGAPTDGEAPLGALVRDAAGNLYGTTVEGGAGRCGNFNCGTAFMLNKTGKELGVFSFDGKDGQFPSAGLFRDAAGNLYGTTDQGGANCYAMGFSGCGTVFRLNNTGTEIRNYSFKGTPDGYFPGSPVVQAGGSLYGTASAGGIDDLGAVFKIDERGTEAILYSFTGGSDGCDPDPGVIPDAAGNLYGVASDGGIGFCNSGLGTVYELDATGKLTVLHAFAGEDGANPDSRLLFDAQGNLYGTTQNGGSSSECGSTGCGVVFEVSPQQGGEWSEAVLYSFCSLPGCADGERPLTGPVVRDAAGNIYGTTYFGGTYGNGVLFKLAPGGLETVLHSFSGGADGANPIGGLVTDGKGNLYGTAEQGGDVACNPPHGCGVVFQLAP
jgi:uncharacterized repeat protein (TIGR03803 family)